MNFRTKMVIVRYVPPIIFIIFMMVTSSSFNSNTLSEIFQYIICVGVVLIFTIPPLLLWYYEIWRENKRDLDDVGSARWAGIGTFVKYLFGSDIDKYKYILAPSLILKDLWHEIKKETKYSFFGTLYMDKRDEEFRQAIEQKKTKLPNQFDKNGRIFIGRTFSRDSHKKLLIGLKDNTHLITSGSIGSGKSVTAIYNNIQLNCSIVVLDPKGEHARNTYQYRSSKEWLKKHNLLNKTDRHLEDGKCFMFDPYGANTNTDMPSHSYNPLSEIDITDVVAATRLIKAVANGSVIPEKGRNSQFSDIASLFFTGAIAHVLTKYPKENHNLPFVYDKLNGIDAELRVSDPKLFSSFLMEMLENDSLDGLPQIGARPLMEAGDRERGAYITTLTKSIAWIREVRSQLMTSDFSFVDIGKGIYTIYIVAPNLRDKEQMRWMRTLTSVSLEITRMHYEGVKLDAPILFLLDEFASLGDIDTVVEAFQMGRSRGVKLWAFVQTIGQIKDKYSKDQWSTIEAGSTMQFFGVRDTETADYISKRLGERIVTKTVKNRLFGKRRIVSEKIYPLLSAQQVMRNLEKSDNTQIIFPSKGNPMFLERLAFKRNIVIDDKKFNILKGKDSLKGYFVRNKEDYSLWERITYAINRFLFFTFLVIPFQLIILPFTGITKLRQLYKRRKNKKEI